jgi:uncharacterized protein YndB with AHSA1/START domain
MELLQNVVIDRPRDEVYRYLLDMANHWEFQDHYLEDFRLTREDPYGVGAGARFKVDMPLNRFDWADLVISEAEQPRRLVLRGRGGKFNRIRIVSIWTLEPGPHGTTRVSLSTETEPVLPSDKLLEAIGKGRLKRRQRKAMKRLRSILEEGEGRGRRASIAAGGARKPATRSGL